MERQVIREGWFTLKSGSWWPTWTDYYFSLYADALEWTLADDDATLVDSLLLSDISDFSATLLLPGECRQENAVSLSTSSPLLQVRLGLGC